MLKFHWLSLTAVSLTPQVQAFDAECQGGRQWVHQGLIPLNLPVPGRKQRRRRLKTSCWCLGFRIPSGWENCEASSRVISAPNSFKGCVPARIFLDSCFIELLKAPEDWWKWLYKCFYRPVSSESHGEQSGGHETLILFQESLQRNYFGLFWVFGHRRPFLSALLFALC